MWAKIYESSPQRCIALAFLYAILCVSIGTTRKLKDACGRFSYQTIALLSTISILWVRAVCDIRSVSHESKHAFQPLSYTRFCAHILTFVTRKLQVVCRCSMYRTTAQLSEMSTFCVRAGCEKRMASNASKHASQSLSDRPFVSIQ